MAVQGFILALEYALPQLAALAAAISSCVWIYIRRQSIIDLLNAFPGSTSAHKREILTDLKALFDEAMNNPAVAGELTFYGVDATMVRAAIRDAIETELQKLGQLYTFPAFPTVEEALTWYGNVLGNYSQGFVSQSYFEQATTWVNAEIARLATVTPPPEAPTVPGVPTIIPSFPTFATIDEANQWYAGILSSSIEGWVTAEYVTMAGTWVNAEIARLALAAAMAQAQTATGAQTVVIPGFGTAQVTVTVQGQAITGELPTVPIVQPGVQPIIVSAPDVTTGETIVNVEAPPAPNVWVTPQLSIGALEASLQALPMALSTSLVGALAASAGQIRHAGNLGALGCMGTTGTALLAQLGLGAAGLALPIAFSKFGPLRQVESGAFDWLLRQWIDPIKQAGEVKPEQAPEVAVSMLNATVMMAVSAHLAAISAEAVTPLKYMGTNYLAGFLAELAGWGRIAGGTVGVLEAVAISQPMKYYVNSLTRSAIPGLGDLEEMYAKKEIGAEDRGATMGLRKALAYQGFSESWIDVFTEYLWRDPRLGEVIRIGQFFSPALVPALSRPDAKTAQWMRAAGIDDQYIDSADWYYAWRAAKGGYDPRDIPVLTETAKRATARREQTLFLDAVTRLTRDGYITTDRARALILEAWEFSNPIEARLRAIDLQKDYKLLQDAKSITVLAMAKGLITRDEARQKLAGLGLDAQRVEIEVLKGTLGMIPGMRFEISRPEEVLEDISAELE